jgi:hypothetical protein
VSLARNILLETLSSSAPISFCAHCTKTHDRPHRLAEIFAGHRRDGLDLSGVIVIDPQFSLLPQIEANGLMRMTGFFPSVPKQVNFDLIFAPVGGQWRLFGISVAVGQSGPVAPPDPPVAQRPPEPPSGPGGPKGPPPKK